ncbi:hypothetical protein ES703_95247 [subsurface metagenome]
MNKRSHLAIISSVVVCCCLTPAGKLTGSENSKTVKSPFPNNADCKIIGVPENTHPDSNRNGKISIEGLLSDIPIDPCQIQSLRPDIFNKGYFSVFDCLVQVCSKHNIDIKYHFDRQLRCHTIDSIDNRKNWWYAAIYHGGGRPEEPIHRMDTHPYKDWMKIEVYQVTKERIDQIYSAFRSEAKRLKSNKNKVIIPEVLIQTLNQNLKFTNVEVQPHRIRSDMFKPDVMTAADIMLSLAEKGKLSLDLLWRGQFGRALVQGYYFTRFNQEQAHGRAGFTYSLGEKISYPRGARPRRFGDNNFHMTTDIRVIVSPQYIHWRWTDLSRRNVRPVRPQPSGK